LSPSDRLAHLDAVKRHLIDEILAASDEDRPVAHLRHRLLGVLHARNALVAERRSV
jgi:hypothetical protein